MSLVTTLIYVLPYAKFAIPYILSAILMLAVTTIFILG